MKLKLFLIRLCRCLSAAGAVFICALPMVLYADAANGDTEEARVTYELEDVRGAGEKTQVVEVTVSANIVPTAAVTRIPTRVPSVTPLPSPTMGPTIMPSVSPTPVPTEAPTAVPTRKPTKIPTPVPTIIRSTTTIVKPMVTTVPVYVPVVKTGPAPISMANPTPTVALPQSGYTGGAGLPTPKPENGSYEDSSIKNGEGKMNDEEVELVIISPEKGAGAEELRYEPETSEIETEAEEEVRESHVSAGGNTRNSVSENRVRQEAEKTEKKKDPFGTFLKVLKWIGIVVLILVLTGGVYAFALYMGWCTLPEIPFFMKDDDENEEVKKRDESKECS